MTSILVAANGPNLDTKLAADIKEQLDVHFIYFDEASYPKTIARTVPLVNTQYFCFLDDDDELLPDSLTHRLEIISCSPQSDVLLSNGYLRKMGKESLLLSYLENVPNNPLENFFTENWLPSCGALFRASTIKPKYFENYHPYVEWSWLAFRLAMDKKQFCILNKPTFRVHADTPFSLSKSSAHQKAYVDLYQRMLNLKPPKNIRKILKARLSQAHHDMSVRYLQDGDIRHAIQHHIMSLAGYSGLRFIAYTRHIIAAALKQ